MQLGLIAVLIIVIVLLEERAKGRRRWIETVASSIRKPILPTGSIAEASAMGLGVSSLTFLDIYNAAENHESVLKTLEYRFNNEMGDANFFDWYTKIETLNQGTDRALQGYVSNYVGQAGENATIEHFANQGLTANLLEKRNYKEFDISVLQGDGTEILYSVKNYGDYSNLEKQFEKNPDVKNWVINKEMYKEMQDNGDLENYQNMGYEIQEGDYLHATHVKSAAEAFEAIEEAGDLTDHIPLIGIIIFSKKLYDNLRKFHKRKQNFHEFKLDVSTDFVKMITIGLFTATGATIGIILGSIIMPGGGNIIWGFTGIVSGSLVGSKFFSEVKERLKWGDIRDSLAYFGKKYGGNEKHFFRDKLQTTFFNKKQLENEANTQERILINKGGSITPYGLQALDFNMVLAEMSHMHFTMMMKHIEDLPNKILKELHSLCREIGEKVSPQDEGRASKFSCYLMGYLIIENRQILMPLCGVSPIRFI